MPGLLVTATDTAVGKTAVACALVRAARAAGLDVVGMKPVESGCARQPDGSLLGEDGVALHAASGGIEPLARIGPYRLEAPLAPGLAADAEGVELELGRIEALVRELAARHAHGVIVEGAGGLLVPIEPGFTTVADLASRLELPVLVVARAGLGTINHTALTVEALATRGIECRGVILNAAAPGGDPSVAGNARAIERLADVPVLASLPHLPGLPREAREETLARLLARALIGSGKMDLAGLLA